MVSNFVFQWRMKADDFHRLITCLRENKYSEDDIFGGVSVGKLLMTFGLDKTDDNNVTLIHTCYRAGKGSYGRLSDNTPYDLLSDNIDDSDFCLDGSFFDFQKSVMNEFSDLIQNDVELTKLARSAKVIPWLI